MQPSIAMQVKIALLTALLALCVVMMGAYVRLSDAGLGCPDWPGCYGQLIAPSAEHEINGELAQQRPLESGKAWKEMIHRYLAGTLGLAILLLAVLAWRNRQDPDQPLALPTALVMLVVFQAALGMWTVTLLVKPAIVTAHLLGGFATLSLLVLLVLRLRRGPLPSAASASPYAWHLWLGLGLLILQIMLGGWTSTNYAALACSEFPTCYGRQWWPEMDFHEAFVIWRGLGVNYEYGVLEPAARVAIHVTHRLGALLVVLVVAPLALRLLRDPVSGLLRHLGGVMLGLLLLQIGLGIANVLGHLPLAIAVVHNGNAALLLVTLIAALRAAYRHA